MSGRSVIETLDLHNDYGDYHSDACAAASQTCGWLSPRISFSTDFIGASGRVLSPEKKKTIEDDLNAAYSNNFEFSMSSSFNVSGSGSPPSFIVPADQLFHQGILLPGFAPPGTTPVAKDSGANIESATTLNIPSLSEAPDGCGDPTIAGHLTTDATTGGPATLGGCVLGPSCLRTPKGPKWRELFGALRRVKSDSGRQRVPDESLLPPKTLHGRRKFFKQLFSSPGPNTQASSEDAKLSSPTSSSGPSSSGLSQVKNSLRCTPAATSVVDSRSRTPNPAQSSLRSTSATATSAVDSRSRVSASAAQSSSRFTSAGIASVDSRTRAAAHPAQSGVEVRPDFRGKGCDQSSEGFTFDPTPGRPKPSANSGRIISPVKAPIRGASWGRSPSGRVIVRGLDRVASGRHSASLQEQVRALRSREIRRSPDRAGYSSVRVTPVLNVPVCMGPVLRGATKAGKGRLSNFRSFLTFKSKLPGSMSAPIATR